MELIYFKSKNGNFGDDLNIWLWKKLLGDFELYPHEYNFVGIGSILDQRIISEKKNIIFGSGIRDIDVVVKDFNAEPTLSFVRGPYSSKMTNLPFITDSAYCFALTNEYSTYLTEKKEYKIAFIPYFEHMVGFDWKLFEKLTNIKVIDPTLPVETFLSEVSKAERILAAAMHGAIVSDILRIPWVRIKFSKHGDESAFTSELKWNDWHKSVGLEKIYEIDTQLSISNNSGNFIFNFLKIFYLKKKLKYLRFNLSEDEVFEEIKFKLQDALDKIKKLK